MRFVVVAAAALGCGRISFDPLGPGGGDAPSGPDTSQPPNDGVPGDTPTTVRACRTNKAYVTSAGLANKYREGTALVTWVAARADCMADDADLWVPESMLELNAFSGDWAGITDVVTENVWLKVDGTVATFLPFTAGEPDGGTDENCLRADQIGFEDRDCTDLRDYVCECPVN